MFPQQLCFSKCINVWLTFACRKNPLIQMKTIGEIYSANTAYLALPQCLGLLMGTRSERFYIYLVLRLSRQSTHHNKVLQTLESWPRFVSNDFRFSEVMQIDKIWSGLLLNHCAVKAEGRFRVTSSLHFLNIYLLCTMACSTRVVFSDGGVPADFWLITDRNCSNSLVLSVFPAPDSPLDHAHTHRHTHTTHFN